MVREAEQYAAEDRAKREAAEARNRGDSLAYQVEKLLKDHGDKISADERSKVENALRELREALKTEDTDRIKRAADAVQQASYRLSEEMYKAAAGQPAGAPAGAPGAAPGGQKPGEDVIDAEYKPSN